VLFVRFTTPNGRRHEASQSIRVALARDARPNAAPIE
jgi:hypothetical protein